ncbi:MAG: hypothetical protein ACRD0I_05470 [Acidimicrobiales bacterium]
MIVLGLLVLIAAAIFGVDVGLKNSYHILSPTAFGNSLNINSAHGLFIVGVITGGGFMLGLLLMVGGAGRNGAHIMRQRRSLKLARADGALTERHAMHRDGNGVGADDTSPAVN